MNMYFRPFILNLTLQLLVLILLMQTCITETKQYQPLEQKAITTTKNVKIKKLELGTQIGIIKIPKIELECSIIEGVTEENLKIYSVHIAETPYPWEKGNCFVSAHRSWTYGKMFNRLEELIIGDRIELRTIQGNFTYQVYKIETVEPDNIEVFNQLNGERNLTLTTCTPLYKATHRLIVLSKPL